MTQPRHRDPMPLGGEDGLPYSKGLMAQALIAVGVQPERAHELARRVEDDLDARGEAAIDFDRLEPIALEQLGDAEGSDAMRRLRRYLELRELDLPVIVLIGGGTGTGKSSVATEVAHRLGITRVTSTDFIRQTMRAFFSREFMPSIHYSSFEAGDALRAPEEAVDPVIAGFLEQSRNVLVGVQASVDRALVEGWSMVLEGVHLVPGLLSPPVARALVVQCVLEIGDEATHAAHFWVRDADSEGGRPMAKYVDRLGEIRRIQRELVERAQREGVPVIETGNMDSAISDVMDLVLAGVERLQKVS